MASLNRVLLMGNLTNDPEMKTLQSGTAVTNFRLALNRRWRDQSGEQREETCFVDIEVFGRQAETVSQYLSKGSSALVEGRLRFHQWQDKESGENRNKLRVLADRVQFVGGRGGGSQAAGEAAGAYTATPQDEGMQEQGSQEQAAPSNSQPQEEAESESGDDIPF